MKRIMTSILLSIGFFLQLGCTNPSAYVDKQTFDAHADLEKIMLINYNHSTHCLFGLVVFWIKSNLNR